MSELCKGWDINEELGMSTNERGTELTPQQRKHWEFQLEVSQRAAQYALKMLGMLPPEKGIE